MKCTACDREIGYHPPKSADKPADVFCPRAGRIAQAVKP